MTILGLWIVAIQRCTSIFQTIRCFFISRITKYQLGPKQAIFKNSIMPFNHPLYSFYRGPFKHLWSAIELFDALYPIQSTN